MTARLHRRVDEARARVLIRAWEYRQRNHSHGTWFRLRRVLADAERAYAIDEHAAQRLITAGHLPEPVGGEIEPPKTILFVDAAALAHHAPEAREVPVALSEDFFSARSVALLRFRG